MDNNNHHQMMMTDFIRRFKLSIILTLPILLLSPMIAEFLGLTEFIDFAGSRLILFLLSTVVFVYGGKPFFLGIIYELRNKNPGMMSLIALAISTAYAYSSAVIFGLEGELFFWELATLIDVMLIGHYIEMRSSIGAGKALEELTKLLPDVAHKLLRGQLTEDVSISKLKIGDRVVVKPGEKIPADGEVVAGESFVSEAILTGESIPTSKNRGCKVIGGSINDDGSLIIRIEKLGEESFISQVILMVREAQMNKSKTQKLADRAAKWLTVVGLGGALLSFGGWYVVGTATLAFALERAVSVMVIACPHALGVAIPLVVSVSTAKSAKAGLLIRNREGFETLRKLNKVVFDKTGTLTHGTFEVINLKIKKGYDKEMVLQSVASAEALSQHPIAQAIARLSKARIETRNFKSLHGEGIEAVVNGKSIKVVSPGYIQRNNIPTNELRMSESDTEGATVVFGLIDGEVASKFILADKIREESKGVVKDLESMGITSYMLTGDNKTVARSVARQIGIKHYFAEVLPEDKLKKIKQLKVDNSVVAMVGDGVNDAPALALADVGVAIGAGTHVALETADVILVRSNPYDVLTAISYAKATYRKMSQNLFWATGYNVVAIPLAAGVLFSIGIVISPALGAAFMSLSTVLVAVNARILKL